MAMSPQTPRPIAALSNKDGILDLLSVVVESVPTLGLLDSCAIHISEQRSTSFAFSECREHIDVLQLEASWMTDLVS